MISKNRPTKGRIGTPYHIETFYQSKQSCKNCIYYEKEDGSCSKRPIALSEVGIDCYRSCKYFEVRQNKNKTNDKDKKIARVIRSTISNKGNLKLAAKSFHISLYQALVIYNNIYGDLKPMNEVNMNKLREYGLSSKKISEFYSTNETIVCNKDVKQSERKDSEIDKIKENNSNYKNQAINDNVITLKRASKDICSLCNKKHKSSRVYYIDNAKSDDKDSILNMVNLCIRCEKEVSKNRTKYEEVLKQKANEIMERIMSLI